MVNPKRSKLAGRVEIDESYLGGELEGGKRGRGAENKTLIMIATELNGKKLGRIRISVVRDASSDSLHQFVTENVTCGSEIATDAWGEYLGIQAYCLYTGVKTLAFQAKPFRLTSWSLVKAEIGTLNQRGEEHGKLSKNSS